MSPTSARATAVAKEDATLAAAIEVARAAAVEEAGADLVGEHAGVVVDDERVVTHLFACLSPGYRGWNWAVTLMRAPRSKTVTVNDVVLLPGDGALLAPDWVPWSERVQPGDLGVGDLLATPADDPRLVPGYSDAESLEGIGSLTPLGFGSWEIGLGRERVLSDIGRVDAAERWLQAMGPDTQMAKQAPLTCSTCGFLVAFGGPLGHLFGACANEMSPADGRVVAMTYGCGAHSQVQVETHASEAGTPIVVDEDAIDIVDLDAIPDPEPEVVAEVVADAADTVAEAVDDAGNTVADETPTPRIEPQLVDELAMVFAINADALAPDDNAADETAGDTTGEV